MSKYSAGGARLIHRSTHSLSHWVTSLFDPKLIIRVINCELVQPIRPRYINVTDSGRLKIEIPRFALYVRRAVKTHLPRSAINSLYLRRSINQSNK